MFVAMTSDNQMFHSDTLRSMIYGIRSYFRTHNAYWVYIWLDHESRFFGWKTPDDIEIVRIE